MASSSFAPKKDNMGSSPSESTRLDISSGNVIPTTPTTITRVLKNIPSSVLLLFALILSICLVSRAQQSSNTDSFSSIIASKPLPTPQVGIANSFGVNILVDTKNFTLTDPRMQYNGSGCGSNKDKGCTCTGDGRGDLVMVGVGTAGTWTGLSFACLFNVDEARCSVKVNIPYWGTNEITCECQGATFIDNCQIGQTSYETNLNMVVKKPKTN